MANITDPNTTNSIWQTVVTILFALSMISERIDTLLKLYFTNAIDEGATPEQQKKYERSVLLIALLCGMLTSFIAGADLFHLIGHNGELLFFSGLFDGQLTIQHITGAILTGFFISLGSKFWHDVLDIILQFSNLKKVQAATATQRLADNNARRLALSKASSSVNELRAMPGFLGYESDQDSSGIILKFNAKVSDDHLKKLNNYIGEGAYRIESPANNDGK